MARQPMITRTIQYTLAEVLCVNTQTGATFNETVTLPRVYKDDKHIIKAAEKVLDTETCKPVHVISATVKENLYGMPESTFIELAQELPTRNTKEPENKTTNI